MPSTIGVLAIQGSFKEHLAAVARLGAGLQELWKVNKGIEGKAMPSRNDRKKTVVVQKPSAIAAIHMTYHQSYA